MNLSAISLLGLLLILNMRLVSTYPINTSLTDTDMDILKSILHKLEESVSEQTEVDPVQRNSLDSLNVEEDANEHQLPTGLDEMAIRDFFSAKNLKNVRNDSSRRSSGCFGRRMDRIGSMSSLGCNTVGKYKSSRGSTTNQDRREGFEHPPPVFGCALPLPESQQ
ncbi:Brain natriuretic peptide B-type natriuretic peptide [Collichthys lucidus]|uniref:Brain natriuretic peptide B-type natriuretic peptide n=1 Tax=Collichthys lucidus TaxID=240159 RepID=A0A4U5UTA0_COLLU|nr:Brain natriuretic peptide B-type natriuretic peptide [Collichthys lucidus]